MELHDNHIRISRSILQVLQSLSRDNHGIFVSLVLFETWLCYVSKLQFFGLWEPAHPSPPILPGPQWWSQAGNFSSVYKAQDTCQKEAKMEVYPPPPRRTKSPPHLRSRARATRPKNCSLSGLLLFERLPCCPVYKLTWVGVSVTGLPVFVFKWNKQQQAVPSSFAALVKSSCVQCPPSGKHFSKLSTHRCEPANPL